MYPRLIIAGLPLEGVIQLSHEDARHIFSSLRMREGERLILCDGKGREALCELTAAREARVLEVAVSKSEPKTAVHLFPSISKGDRFEWLLQKSAELGAVSITPVWSERCVAGRPTGDRMERYSKILRSAAEQSGRAIVPEMRNTLEFKDVVSNKTALGLFCYEDERCCTLKSVLPGAKGDISILTGPEGGYTPQEAQMAAQHGWKSVSLGERILRCETAPLMVLSAIRFLEMEE